MAQEDVYDVFSKQELYGIHHPVHFHAFRSTTSFFPFLCLCCSKIIYPFSHIGTCVKCSISIHRSCCHHFRNICPHISANTPINDVASDSNANASDTEEILGKQHNILYVSTDEQWRHNLYHIWTSVTAEQKLQFKQNIIEYKIILKPHGNQQLGTSVSISNRETLMDYSHFINMLSVESSFIRFTMISLINLYLNTDTPNKDVADTTEEKLHVIAPKSSNIDIDGINSGRNCLNTIIQAIVLWLIETKENNAILIREHTELLTTIATSHTTAINTNLPKMRRMTLSIYNYMIYDAITQYDDWKQFVNIIEDISLRWNNKALYKKIYAHIEASAICAEKNAKIREIVNHSLLSNISMKSTRSPSPNGRVFENAKLPPSNSSDMRLLKQLESIHKEAVSPLDKLHILVLVLQSMSKDISDNTKGNSRALRSFSSRSQLQSSISNSNLSSSNLNKPDENIEKKNEIVVVDADQLVQKLTEILKYSYLSGSQINWHSECLYMTNILFTGVQGYKSIDEILVLKEQPSTGILSLAFTHQVRTQTKKNRYHVIREDWLLGADGYALVTLQQALDGILHSS